MSITVPLPGLVDIRQPILGDSFGWAGLEPTAAKKSLLIHHSASPNNQDGFDIASHHVNNNGWGGIGYHFVITHDSYAGRPNFTPPGAQVQYVGDLNTWRAHAMNDNPGRVGICLVGNFVNGVPGKRQLELTRELIDFLIAPNNILPSINFHSQVIGHGQLQGQSTACPGYANPNYAAWFGYLRGGGFPANLYAAPLPTPEPPVVPTPPTPETPTIDPVPGKGGRIELPSGDLVINYREEPSQRPVARDGAHGIDVTTGQVTVPNIPVGTVIDVAAYFDFNGRSYARTVYSATHGKWNGLDTEYFNPIEVGTVTTVVNGQPSGDIPVTVIPPDPTAVQEAVTDEQLQAAVVPELPKLTIGQLINELLAKLFAMLIRKKESK